MGLSSKQVSIDGFDWSKALMQAQKLELPKLAPSSGMKRSQHQNQNQIQPQIEQLKCPRCDSTNTKFCYYNNYNKSQPRHFCRACKRHWTKGGTLRNVPVGGGRKNKRLKKKPTPKSTKSSSSAVAADVINPQMDVHHLQNLPLYQGLIFSPPSSSNWAECENFTTNYGILNSQPPDFSAVSTTTSTHSPMSPKFNNYSDQELKPTETEQPANSTSTHHPWELPSTACGVADMSNSYWSWDDINTFAATDLNIPWDDDHDIKP
ncbi:unnamed protein product [Citrullus colocynthis]|uniref:Dof zinc finger protein n=1 Tax=Citrullus colocynthis TaxID=252529 RepID=A0ABP0YNB0_9ROSI